MSNAKLIRTPLIIVGSWLALVIAGAVFLLVVSVASQPGGGGSPTDKDIKTGTPASSSSSKGTRT